MYTLLLKIYIYILKIYYIIYTKDILYNIY